ncbi:protoheme IX farnesyltransferase [Longispora fulva]|nr:protoheme IX farnesyltransferase [Longispora fulva]
MGLVRAYISLTKPRIVELLLVTTVPAMLLAKRGMPSPWLILATVVGGTLAAGSANVLNCWYDRDIDPLMRRTQSRPLVTGRITPRGALTFGLTLGTVAVALMALTTNWLATALTFAAIVYYAVIYTMWLKRTTPHNTVLGGACGAAPVLIGWAAVTGGLSWSAWLLFAVMFFWQPPHFWALAMKFKDDYAAASIPMLPVVASARRVALESVIYTVLTVVASLALWPVAHLSWVYGVPAAAAGAVFTREAVRFYVQTRRGGELRTMRLFHWSLTYVTVLFVAVAVDALLTG